MTTAKVEPREDGQQGARLQLGRRGGPWWQVARHWGAYAQYLETLQTGLERLPMQGQERVAPESSFVPVQLRRWSDEDAQSAAPLGASPRISLAEALEDRPQAMVVGPAGTGKSALLRWEAIRSARELLKAGRKVLLSSAGPPPIPIYLALAGAPVDVPLEVYAAQTIEESGFEGAAAFLRAHLEAGAALILIDDLDTLSIDGRREAAVRIDQLLQAYPETRIAVATRDPVDQRWLPKFELLEVAGVEQSRLDALIARWGYGRLAAASGFSQMLERSDMVRSLVSRPGWLYTALNNLSEHEGRGPVRAYDIVSDFVRQIDQSDEGARAEARAPWPEIALDLQHKGVHVGSLEAVPEQGRGSGLIQLLADEQFRFVHPAVQAFFSSKAMAEDEAGLVERAEEPLWEPVILLAVGHRAEPLPLIEALMEAERPMLAARALAEMRQPPAALRRRAQIELLQSLGTGENDRAVAISLAGMQGGGETVRRAGLVTPALTALSASEPEIRVAAAEALERLGDPSAIAPLLTALGDGKAEVRNAASSALAQFGDRTVQPLVRQLNLPDEQLRRAAMRALALQGSRAVKALVPLLDSASDAVRAEAAGALAGIGREAVPALVEVLQGAPPRGTRTETQVAGASEALTQIGGPAARALVPIFAEADPPVANRINEIVQAIGTDAIGALGEILAEPEHPQAGAAASLLGAFEEGGEKAATHLAVALGEPRFEIRWEVRRSLRRLGAAALPALEQTLEAEDPAVRWEAAQILMALDEPPIEPLIRTLTGILASKEVADRRRAVRALGSLSGPEVRQALEAVIDDQDPMVRRSAISQIGNLEDPAAATALIKRWEVEEDEETQLAILAALADLAPEAAVPTLIEALSGEESELRQEASERLARIGEPAVVPLIRALNARPEDLDLDSALRVLERAGSGARAGGRSPANLARTYHRLMVEPLEVDELVYMATTIEWWPPALELHRTFATAKQFLGLGSLGGIGSAEEVLEWVDSVEVWLRPPARRAMRQLRMISQAVQYYNRGATRRSKEKGLLAAADRLNSLRQMIPEMGEPHTRVFHSVAEHWSGLINEAIRELQGRADLELELRTEHVRIRDAETAAVLVFDLINSGEGLASNVQLQLGVEEAATTLESPPVHYLPPLGQGDRISSEYTVRQQGAGVVPMQLEVRYDDPQKEGQTRRFNREVRFYVEEAEYKEIGTSPYIAGPPVKSPEMFYGRQSTFNWIQENLSGTFQDNVLVLYGERRTGKTSVLYQLQRRLPDTYAFVLIDLQTIAYSLSSTSDLLFAMARKLINGLRRQGFELERPKREDFADHPIEHFETLGEDIGEMALAMDRKAVLIADEFDLLIEAIDRGDVSPFVFDCIRGLMQHQDGLSFIFAGAHALTAMIKNPRSILFNTALRRKVSFLEQAEAERLVREPVAEVLWYDDLAVEKVLRVTAGQPYFIQYICHEIVNLARRDAKNFVTLRDVDRALQTTVQETTGIIRHSYMSLSAPEQLALAALARITDDGRPFVSLEDIAETLRQDDIHVRVRDLHEHMHGLAERDFVIERGGGDTAGRQYGFAMDLVRVWLEQNDEYTRLLEEQSA